MENACIVDWYRLHKSNIMDDKAFHPFVAVHPEPNRNHVQIRNIQFQHQTNAFGAHSHTRTQVHCNINATN